MYWHSGRAAGTLAVLSLMSWLIAWSVWAATLHGKVIGVSDGDTIAVLDADEVVHKVRLAGIDTPEKPQSIWRPIQAAFERVGAREDGLRRLAQDGQVRPDGG